MNTNHRRFHILRFVLLGLFILTLAGTAISEGKDNFFPLEKIKPGLSGYGYTVFQGLKIEKFKVKVLAITENEKQPGRLILVRLSGGTIEKNGGLSAGMSGSPVYISGRLVGAISYGFENADPYLALVTPIEDMLKLMDDQTIAGKPMGTPVLVSGMGRRGYEMVRSSLEHYGLQAMATPALKYPYVNLNKVTLQPGSAIGAQMILGDYQMSAIGTVTMIDPQSGNFLAFGHPFTNRGTVDYLAEACYIFQTVKSPVMSFKMGAPLKPVGRIIQDRQAGILGHLGETPSLIGVTVKVQDQERNLERQSSFQVITDEQLYRDLIIAGVTDAVDQAISRVGTGTATVGLRITLGAASGAATGPSLGTGTGAASGAATGPSLGTGTGPALGTDNANTGSIQIISRENLFFGKDIAAACLGDLQTALDILALNDYAAAPIRSIDLDIRVQPQQITARILKLSGTPTKVKPGETVTVSVAAHSYRGVDFTVPFEVKLPANLEPGKLVLTVRGGSGAATESVQSKKTPATPDYYTQDKSSLVSMLADYVNAPKNNEFVLEYQPNVRSTANNDPKETEPSKLKSVQLKAGAGYVILGEAQLTLEVVQE